MDVDVNNCVLDDTFGSLFIVIEFIFKGMVLFVGEENLEEHVSFFGWI